MGSQAIRLPLRLVLVKATTGASVDTGDATVSVTAGEAISGIGLLQEMPSVTTSVTTGDASASPDSGGVASFIGSVGLASTETVSLVGFAAAADCAGEAAA